MEKLDFSNKLILAPMVRICSLPTRLLALDYGADIVYCEEIIDFKILSAERRVNNLLGTIDYVLSDDTVVFRTCPELEKKNLVFQLGTSNAERALKAARIIEKDVSAVDVNMGCPKEFSIKGGMGAALLTQPEKVRQILTSLVNGLSIPVTCKIRILPTLEETLSLVKLIESTGVSAIAVHGRLKEERPRHKNHNDVIKAIAQTVNIPVIANGGSGAIHKFGDIEHFRTETGASSVMLARAAQWNVSIFRRAGVLPLFDVVRQFLQYAIDYDNQYTNTKYCILQIMHADMDRKEGLDTQTAQCMEEICQIWGMEDYYNESLKKKNKYIEEIENTLHNTNADIKQWETENGEHWTQMPVKFIKKDYPVAISPKQKLFAWTHQVYISKPKYETEERADDRCFQSVVTVDGHKYTTSFWEKSKQFSEQGAAICALIVLGLEDGRKEGVVSPNDIVAKHWKELNKKGTNSIAVTTTSSCTNIKQTPHNAGQNSGEVDVLNNTNDVKGTADRKNRLPTDGEMPQVEVSSKKARKEDCDIYNIT